MKERNQLVDMLKGYACFLVVFGHVIMGIRKSMGGTVPACMITVENFIWTFHVALFMFLSGYVYHLNGDWKSKNNAGKFILHKLFNLGVPYLVFSSFYILINCIMSSSVNTEFKLIDILYLWKTPVAQYWFIYALFWLFVIFSLAGVWMKNWQITCCLAVIKIVFSLLQINAGSFSGALNMCLAFGVGASIQKIKIESTKWPVKACCIIVHIVSVLLILRTPLDVLWIGSQIEAFIGIVGSIALISLLSHLDVIKRFLLWICKYSFPIYLLHTIFTSGIRIVLFKFGIRTYGIHVICGLVLGIILPFFTACIFDRFKPLNFFFYPSKTINALKKEEN